jgi:hypothetical protein
LSLSASPIGNCVTNSLADILTGSNDEGLLYCLYSRIERARNPAQALFVDAWELSEFIASDGFEFLFEQQRSLDEFTQVFVDIGFPEAASIFQKVKAVVPDAMLKREYDSELREHLTRSFDRLKELFYEYLDASNAHLMPALGEFVRKHKDEFAAELTEPANDG